MAKCPAGTLEERWEPLAQPLALEWAMGDPPTMGWEQSRPCWDQDGCRHDKHHIPKVLLCADTYRTGMGTGREIFGAGLGHGLGGRDDSGSGSTATGGVDTGLDPAKSTLEGVGGLVGTLNIVPKIHRRDRLTESVVPHFQGGEGGWGLPSALIALSASCWEREVLR